MSDNDKKEPQTIGHAIDGIEEYDNPLPGWWLLMFYGAIIFSVIYWFLYPSWFGKGYLGWSQISQYEEEVKQAKILYPEKVVSINDFIGKDEFINKGKEIFAQNCASCHGPEGKGLVGPNLTDNVWIHGGKPEEIFNTITKGVTAKGMPTWGPVLGKEKVALVGAFVYSLSHDSQGNLLPSAKQQVVASIVKEDKIIDLNKVIGNPEHIAKGKEIFTQNCVSCHGPEGKGLVGPNLTDSVWIHGGKPENIRDTITKGVAAKGMPTWGPILGSEKIADVTAFVYSLSNK
ncbi:MAG: Cbb3-type cytochrome c oxidase subunit [Candidatus Sericytochromatia bacterium]|nr:MAG: Cbb3-type cytochrome c oxidase subunit [Candidatus Sericytochromatia bacterium]